MKKNNIYDGGGLMPHLLKFVKVMKITFLLLVVVLVQVSASTYSQSKKLTLNVKDVTLSELFREIEKNSEFRFFYDNSEVDLSQKIALKKENSKIDEILVDVSKKMNFSYEIIDRHIIIKRSNDGLSKNYIRQQQIPVSGKVTDNHSIPIPGVTVFVKGASVGTITDTDGNYSLTNVMENATLVFSFIGMKTQEIAVEGKQIIDIVLLEATIGLDEVVAIGYGTMKKSDLTGSVASVSADELITYPTHSIEQALQGRVSGVQITTLNGEPGSDVKIRVRGSTSINADSDPLYVVDGFAGANLPPAEDIQSVEILKDASATAIYGSRGANGVIIITTKKGKAGELKVEANASYSVQKISNTIDMLDAEGFAQYQNDYFLATGSATVPYPNPTELGAGTDWQDVIFRIGKLQNYQVSLSGGTEKLKVYSSAKYYNQKGTILGSGYEMFNGRSNIDFDFSEKIKFSTQMQFNHYYKHGAPTQNLQSGGNGVISGALTFQPNLGIYDNNGNYTVSTTGNARNNPYAIIKEWTQETIGDDFVWNTYMDIEVLKNLKLHSSFGFQRGSSRYGSYISKAIIEGADNDGEARMSSNRSETLITENYLTYNNTFSDFHKLNIMAGYSYQSRKDEALWAGNNGFLTDAFIFWNLGAGSSVTTPGSSLTKWVISSYYARFNYNYKDRYLITVTGREDGSSRFGANNKWAFFPSFALAWNVKQEPFMQHMDGLNHLKLRASYGLTGNTEIGAYKSLARLKDVLAIMGGERVNAVVPSSVANSDLSWESTAQSDIGLDFGFLNGRINFALDYYSMTTSDLLYEVPLPSYSGYSTSLRNWGKVRNRGFEIAVNSVVSDNLFKWTTDFNISFNRNEIMELPEGDVIWSAMPGGIYASSTHIRRVGQPNGVFYGFVFDGVYNEGDDFSGEPDKNPGDIKYKDVNGRDANGNLVNTPDGKVDNDDRQIVGNPNPDFVFGLANNFKYKNFELNVFVNGSVGNDMINYTRLELETMNGFNNTTTAYYNAWTPTNTDTDVPAVIGSATWEFSSRWVEDASYLRVKNITLGYWIPNQILKKLNLGRCKLYVSGQNLFTLTKYSGYDPDVSWNDSNTNFGTDYGSYPNVRSYTIGMNIEF